MPMKNPVRQLRQIGFIEAISFLLLLGVAMPLKYMWGQPLAVKLVGWVHGILFILLVGMLIRAALAARWPVTRSLLVVVAALLPFGPFLIDRKMKTWATEWDAMKPSPPNR